MPTITLLTLRHVCTCCSPLEALQVNLSANTVQGMCVVIDVGDEEVVVGRKRALSAHLKRLRSKMDVSVLACWSLSFSYLPAIVVL